MPCESAKATAARGKNNDTMFHRGADTGADVLHKKL